jgi:hypothetical protein
VFLSIRISSRSAAPKLIQIYTDVSCSNEEMNFMPWPPEIGWNNNKENYFCMWLHREK